MDWLEERRCNGHLRRDGAHAPGLEGRMQDGEDDLKRHRRNRDERNSVGDQVPEGVLQVLGREEQRDRNMNAVSGRQKRH